MRAMFAVAIALSMAMGGIFMYGSGFSAAVGQDDRAPTISDTLEERASANDSVSFESSARSQDDGSIAGFIISGTSELVRIVSMVALLPVTLRDLGFPQWFAYPIGLGFYILVTMGIAQFAGGRIFR
jgi:hypothetical protein